MSTSDWTYNYPQAEQADNYEQEPEQMQLSPAEFFAYQVSPPLLPYLATLSC